MTARHRLGSSLTLGLFLASLMGCGSGDDVPAISPTAALAGARVSLAWEPVQDPTVRTYTLHFGRESSGQAGSCHYEDSVRVFSASATVTGLEPNTRYYFAVSSSSDTGLTSPCSDEVSTVTAPPQS